MVFIAVVTMLIVFWMLLDLQRQIREVEDFVRTLHTDFAMVVYKQHVGNGDLDVKENLD